MTKRKPRKGPARPPIIHPYRSQVPRYRPPSSYWQPAHVTLPENTASYPNDNVLHPSQPSLQPRRSTWSSSLPPPLPLSINWKDNPETSFGSGTPCDTGHAHHPITHRITVRKFQDHVSRGVDGVDKHQVPPTQECKHENYKWLSHVSWVVFGLKMGFKVEQSWTSERNVELVTTVVRVKLERSETIEQLVRMIETDRPVDQELAEGILETLAEKDQVNSNVSGPRSNLIFPHQPTNSLPTPNATRASLTEFKEHLSWVISRETNYTNYRRSPHHLLKPAYLMWMMHLGWVEFGLTLGLSLEEGCRGMDGDGVNKMAALLDGVRQVFREGVLLEKMVERIGSERPDIGGLAMEMGQPNLNQKVMEDNAKGGEIGQPMGMPISAPSSPPTLPLASTEKGEGRKTQGNSGAMLSSSPASSSQSVWDTLFTPAYFQGCITSILQAALKYRLFTVDHLSSVTYSTGTNWITDLCWVEYGLRNGFHLDSGGVESTIRYLLERVNKECGLFQSIVRQFERTSPGASLENGSQPAARNSDVSTDPATQPASPTTVHANFTLDQLRSLFTAVFLIAPALAVAELPESTNTYSGEQLEWLYPLAEVEFWLRQGVVLPNEIKRWAVNNIRELLEFAKKRVGEKFERIVQVIDVLKRNSPEEWPEAEARSLVDISAEENGESETSSPEMPRSPSPRILCGPKPSPVPSCSPQSITVSAPSQSSITSAVGSSQLGLTYPGKDCHESTPMLPIPLQNTAMSIIPLSVSVVLPSAIEAIQTSRPILSPRQSEELDHLARVRLHMDTEFSSKPLGKGQRRKWVGATPGSCGSPRGAKGARRTRGRLGQPVPAGNASSSGLAPAPLRREDRTTTTTAPAIRVSLGPTPTSNELDCGSSNRNIVRDEPVRPPVSRPPYSSNGSPSSPTPQPAVTEASTPYNGEANKNTSPSTSHSTRPADAADGPAVLDSHEANQNAVTTHLATQSGNMTIFEDRKMDGPNSLSKDEAITLEHLHSEKVAGMKLSADRESGGPGLKVSSSSLPHSPPKLTEFA